MSLVDETELTSDLFQTFYDCDKLRAITLVGLLHVDRKDLRDGPIP